MANGITAIEKFEQAKIEAESEIKDRERRRQILENLLDLQRNFLTTLDSGLARDIANLQKSKDNALTPWQTSVERSERELFQHRQNYAQTQAGYERTTQKRGEKLKKK